MNAPYQQVNDDCGCIFIHVPKVAGISIESKLFDCKIGHHTALEYRHADPDRFERYYKFAFVRQPQDRLRSAFRFLKAGGRNEHDAAWSKQHLADCGDFTAFVNRLADSDFSSAILRGVHFRPQHQYVCDKDEVIVDFLGKFESLGKDFEQVASRLGVDDKLPWLNRSKPVAEDVELDDESVSIIRNIYQKDYDLLGYADV